MSTLDMNKHFRRRLRDYKISIIYLAVAVFCIITDHVYAIFGHGVRSASMTYMFLYPLAAAVLSMVVSIRPLNGGNGWRRLGTNAVASGTAALTVGAFLRGILEIAGSSSAYVVFFYLVGWLFAAAGLAATIAGIKNK